MNIVVLGGGNSPERAVSLRSAQAVVDALAGSGHTVTLYDTLESLEGVLSLRPDVVLPMLHGLGGEDGVVQEFLEQQKLRYLGSSPSACQNTYDKQIFLDAMREHGVLVPEGALVNREEFMNSPLSNRPFVLKPFDGGSSLDTFIVRSGDKSEVPFEVFDRHDRMLIEECISGVEITVAILGSEALPTVEIVPPENEEFDYENKYNGKTKDLCPAPSLSNEQQIEAEALGLKVHQIMECRHLSRVDMIVTNPGEIYVLELNTLPGMTNQSLYPVAAKQAGYPMDKLVATFIKLAST